MPRFNDWFGHLSTGIKIFSIITLALLPLGLIALIASLGATRSAETQRSTDLRVAVTQSSRKLGMQLAADIGAMRAAADTIAAGEASADICTRLNTIFSARGRRISQFAIFGPASAPLCASPAFVPLRPSTISPDIRPEASLSLDALNIIVPAGRGAAVVVVRYPAATLFSFAQPSALGVPYALSLSDARATLLLRSSSRSLPLGSEAMAAPVGILDLTVSISAASISLGATGILLTFLPLLMWASAALIGFFVVDRLLIRPLRTLRLAVASHVPGMPFTLPVLRTPAREIRELGETFAQFGDEISQHGAEMTAALADQTKATREVHHRVKNNLQVIASLISLHARGPHSPDAATAYAAIQRRVDALAIVHRNHYAELDADGIDIKALLGELAANLRAGAGHDAPAISVSAPRFSVSQDIAVAIAFLLTELIELSMTLDAAAPIAISVADGDATGRSQLNIASTALRTSREMTERLAGRYARVLEGLSRQLRAPLDHDGATGCYSIVFAIAPVRETI